MECCDASTPTEFGRPPVSKSHKTNPDIINSTTAWKNFFSYLFSRSFRKTQNLEDHLNAKSRQWNLFVPSIVMRPGKRRNIRRPNRYFFSWHGTFQSAFLYQKMRSRPGRFYWLGVSQYSSFDREGVVRFPSSMNRPLKNRKCPWHRNLGGDIRHEIGGEHH